MPINYIKELLNLKACDYSFLNQSAEKTLDISIYEAAEDESKSTIHIRYKKECEISFELTMLQADLNNAIYESIEKNIRDF